MSRFPATTLHPGIRPAPAPCPAPRCVPASPADRPALQIPIRALSAATPLLRESPQTPIPEPRDLSLARVHSPLAAPAHMSSSAAAIPATCRTPRRPAPFLTSLGLLQLHRQMTCDIS